LVKLKSSLRKFYDHHHDLVDRYGIYVSQMTTDMFHLSWTLPGPFLIHNLLSGFVTRLTRRLSLVEQELLTFPEHPSSPQVFSCSCFSIFYVYVLQIVVCPFVLFLLAIVSSVLLRFMDSDYPFGIFKLFLKQVKTFTFDHFFFKFILSYKCSKQKVKIHFR
jgi:hypothetical protein